MRFVDAENRQQIKPPRLPKVRRQQKIGIRPGFIPNPVSANHLKFSPVQEIQQPFREAMHKN
jgi:hypothetical protein